MGFGNWDILFGDLCVIILSFGFFFMPPGFGSMSQTIHTNKGVSNEKKYKENNQSNTTMY